MRSCHARRLRRVGAHSPIGVATFGGESRLVPGQHPADDVHRVEALVGGDLARPRRCVRRTCTRRRSATRRNSRTGPAPCRAGRGSPTGCDLRPTRRARGRRSTRAASPSASSSSTVISPYATGSGYCSGPASRSAAVFMLRRPLASTAGRPRPCEPSSSPNTDRTPRSNASSTRRRSRSDHSAHRVAAGRSRRRRRRQRRAPRHDATSGHEVGGGEIRQVARGDQTT